jgi:predicted ATPase/class 3 adenylate cyclase
LGRDQRMLPEGTVTFAFTDIEGSTRMAAASPDGFRMALADHNELVRDALATHGGHEVRTEGDSFFAVFVSAPDAVRFAADAQRRLADHPWPDGCEVRVRMGLHTGTGVRAEHESDDYVGIHVHRAARIQAAAHGGQVLVSEATRAVAQSDLEDITLLDLGEHRLKDLEEPEHLFQLVLPGLQTKFAELRSVSGIANNLPTELTTFVGREMLLNEATKLLETTRVLTLTGPGGTGKTRLSLELGRAALGSFPDGVFFVDLASIEDADLVAPSILGAIGIQARAGTSPRDHLVHFMSRRTALLILDNFEQILDAAPLVSDVVIAAPGLKVVVTSRAALHVRGERELPVPPLDVPGESDSMHPEALQQHEAVLLFLDRAQAVRPDFALDAGNAAAVARLVARLDGLPLAIELAAARVKAFPIPTILERLGSGMLEGTARDLPERQRTITAAIRWSYDLLSGPCRALFERFAVFTGGAGLDEIEAVCGPSDDLGGDLFAALTELIDQSLVVPPSADSHGQYQMLVTIRAFAQDCLVRSGRDGEMRRRHLDAYLGLVEQAAPELVRSDQRRWLDRLAVDHENIRAAARFAMEKGDTAAAARLIIGMWRFWQIRGHLDEGAERAAAVLAMEGVDPLLRLGVLEAAGGIGYWQGDEGFVTHYEEALALAREVGDPSAVANALYNLSFAGVFGSDADRYVSMLEEALEIYDELDDVAGRARVHWGIGNAFGYTGRIDEAHEYFERSASEFAETDLVFDRAWALFALAYGQLQSGSSGEDVEEVLRSSLEIFQDASDVSALVMHLAGFAAAAMGNGEKPRAYRLAGATSRLRDETGYGLVDSPENRYAGLTPEELQHLQGVDAARYAEGRAMSVKDAIAYALREFELEGDAG